MKNNFCAARVNLINLRNRDGDMRLSLSEIVVPVRSKAISMESNPFDFFNFQFSKKIKFLICFATLFTSFSSWASFDRPAKYYWIGSNPFASAYLACKDMDSSGPNGSIVFNYLEYFRYGFSGEPIGAICYGTFFPLTGPAVPKTQHGTVAKFYQCDPPSQLISSNFCREDSPPLSTPNSPGNLGPGCTTTNPIKIGTGNKWLSESDISITDNLGFLGITTLNKSIHHF